MNEIGWNNVKIILIESYPCDNREELIKREQYWIDQLHPLLNLHPAYTPPENFSEYWRKYKDISIARNGQRVMCICGKDIRRGGAKRHRRTKIHERLMAKL